MEKHATDLTPHLAAFRMFVRRRVNSPDIADDILSDSLLRAVRAAPELEDTQAILPWFYTILRNAITDHYRRDAAASRTKRRLAVEVDGVFEPEDADEACACLLSLVETLKPEYAELIREMDLKGAELSEMAARLGVSKANLKVRHHRARKRLRVLLERTCRTCAVHGCIDCTCPSPS